MRALVLTHFRLMPIQVLKYRDGLVDQGFGTPASGGIRSTAVILFHANGQVGLDLWPHAKWYSKRGMHALMVCLGGYGGNEGETSELSTCVLC